MNKLVCITGMPGAGKSIVSDYFVQKGYRFVRFGQITIDIIKKDKLPLNEATERKVREGLREKYGMDAFAKLNFPKFKKLLKDGNVVADGLYSWSEYKFLKKKLGKKLVIISVFAPPLLRYERLSKRVLHASDKDSRERPLSKNEAKSRDYAEIENLEKGGPIAMADYTIINTKDLKYLFSQAEEIYREIEKKN